MGDTVDEGELRPDPVALPRALLFPVAPPAPLQVAPATRSAGIVNGDEP